MRRLLVPAAAFVALAALPAPAFAAPAATVSSPAAGSTVDGEQPMTIRVRANGEAVGSVTLRLSPDGRAPLEGSRTVSASCLSGCGTENSTWQAANFRPTNGAPFASEQVCNGYWWIQPSVNGGPFNAGTQFTLAAPPAAPSGLVAEVVDHATGRAVDLSWNATHEPDHAGYAVERSRDGGPFLEIIRLGPGDTSYLDGGLSSGTYEYRVKALRPDGVVDGRPAQPCADTEGDLATASASRTVTVQQPDGFEPDPEPTPEPTSSESESEGSGYGGGTHATNGSDADDQPSDGESTGATNGDPDDSDGGGSGSTTRSSGGRRPVAPPPRASGATADTSAPAVSGGTVGGETYYGEDEEFSEEIDYGDADAVALTGGDDDSDGPRLETTFVPQAMEDFVNATVLDPDKMRTLALGLLMVTVGMHFRRWLRDGRS